MKKEFNWEEFKNKKMVVNCKNEEEVDNFFKECELNEIEVRSYTREFSYETYHSDVCYRCEDNDLYYADRSFYNNNYGYDIVRWTDYMDNKKELNYIEVYKYPLESIFKSGDDIVKLTNNGFGQKTLKVQIQENWYEAIEPNENWANAKFTLVSLPSKQVTFKEAIKEFSKGGNIQSELNGNKKIYVGLKANGKQKETLTTYEGFNLTTEEILNAKWYIFDKIERY